MRTEKPDGRIEVRFGLRSVSVEVKAGTTIEKLIRDTTLSNDLGFDPNNISVLMHGSVVPLATTLAPGEILVLITAANTKGLGTPKKRKCEKWRRDHRISTKPAKGDHEKWLVEGQSVQINYIKGELDLASLKALARILKRKPLDLSLEIQSV